ncbi:hypothetical protein HOT49_gp252 [Erwinia phage vB_EamM_Alexandra]|uniref:Uncharacterized protein n=1 Tax=Erwinia phage vB_EamM_Alexandra TaxID=2201424 RepID=A0A2Z4QFC9_9CAUD|nr:hypothetical protein HOT49_gp252 [Erwinia phage vB_EamM_Alexandra]AWY08511.1 hypothetical protein Alexandra_254 [Erwinia phage vB_EamM_Alexandra]
MSLINPKGVQSLSAPTKAQKDAAVYMFGSKGHSIVAVLDKFSRAKEVRTAHIDGLLKLMKEGDDEEIIKFTASAAGKKSLAAAKQFAVAKTLAASIKALKLVRVPLKWIAGHSDAAAARITETKEIRARKTAGNKPEKPIKLDNPHAPEAVDMSPAALYDAAHRAKNTAPFEAVHKAVAASLKQFGLKTELAMNKIGDTLILVKAGKSVEGRISFPSSKRKLGWDNDDPNAFFLGAQNAEERDLVMDYVTTTFKNAPATVAKAYEKLWEKAAAGEFGDIPVRRVPGAKKPKPAGAKPVPEAKPAAKYTPSGKSDVTLVDELAEVTARKISAKPMQAREEYFNALRNVLQKNLPKTVVAVVSNGVTVVGKRDYVINLNDNAWTIKTGVTGKPKRIGATFDIVDLLGMLDKSILRPKPDAAKPAPAAAPAAAKPVKPAPAKPAPVKKTEAQAWSDRGLSSKIARLIPNQARKRDSFYLALSNIAYSLPNFDMSRVNIYDPGEMLSITTQFGDWRLIRGEDGWPELQLSGRHESPTVAFTTWDLAKTRYVNMFEAIEDGTYATKERLVNRLEGMVTSQTHYPNAKRPYRVNYDPADQNNYDFTLINMTPEGLRKADFKTVRDFAYNYIQHTIQYRIGHENWIEFDDTGGKPTWKIEYEGKKFLLEAHGSKAWELVRTDNGTNAPIDLGATIDPYKVSKLVMQ